MSWSRNAKSSTTNYAPGYTLKMAGCTPSCPRWPLRNTPADGIRRGRWDAGSVFRGCFNKCTKLFSFNKLNAPRVPEKPGAWVLLKYRNPAQGYAMNPPCRSFNVSLFVPPLAVVISSSSGQQPEPIFSLLG